MLNANQSRQVEAYHARARFNEAVEAVDQLEATLAAIVGSFKEREHGIAAARVCFDGLFDELVFDHMDAIDFDREAGPVTREVRS